MRSISCAVFIFSLLLAPPLLASPIFYQKVVAAGIPAHLVTIDLSNKNTIVTPSLTLRGKGSYETLTSIVRRTRPTAAVSGTFFDTKSFLPTGDIVIEGKLVHSGFIGTALCIDQDNRIYFIPRKRGLHPDWSGYNTVIAGGITLLREGKDTINPKSEGFKAPALFHPASRVAIGATSRNKLLIVVVTRKIYLRDLARIMLALGAIDAMAIDGGSSTGLYASGRMVAKPKRSMTNTLMVFANEEQYSNARTQLAPTHINAETLTPRQIRLTQQNKTPIERLALTPLNSSYTESASMAFPISLRTSNSLSSDPSATIYPRSISLSSISSTSDAER